MYKQFGGVYCTIATVELWWINYIYLLYTILQTVLQALTMSERHWVLTTQSVPNGRIHVNSSDTFNGSFSFFHTKMLVTRINEEEQGLPRRTKSFSPRDNFKALWKVPNNILCLKIECKVKLKMDSKTKTRALCRF